MLGVARQLLKPRIIHGHGTPPTGRGTPVMFSREEEETHNGHGKPPTRHGTLVMFFREEDEAPNGRGTPNLGRATPVQQPREEEQERKAWVCHLGSKVWHARLTKCLRMPWAYYLGSKAWHAREIDARGMPLEELSVACQAKLSG
ncbi:hypothetical protein AHAS_Ahas05G0052700 [Arachis hypogaea]